MSEVNGPKISVNQLNFHGVQKHNEQQPVPEVNEESSNQAQLTDFSDTKAEALGRSMLFKGTDSVNNDLKSLVDNPQIAENSDELFELALDSAIKSGAENPYEEASSASTTAM